ncbi:hypothetical protein RFI_11577 [Reticulomyxa filosa]|uniref:Uncharacterized protein n=1 Tax=Reticulomyxa filosa TaxID=46433 RepID=X6NHS2_RETFI|nr:hypothetical protein RFI_11577 [Reticulomyxa filosa]|eukprot:ETO25561.1 hypothetical protein RFI_11577 [Reticulomyxa filosa]
MLACLILIYKSNNSLISTDPKTFNWGIFLQKKKLKQKKMLAPQPTTSITVPLGVKLLFVLNIIFYVLELVDPTVVSRFGLLPTAVYTHIDTNWPRLFLHNFLHIPFNASTGPMGILHITLNMMTVWSLYLSCIHKLIFFVFLKKILYGMGKKISFGMLDRCWKKNLEHLHF